MTKPSSVVAKPALLWIALLCALFASACSSSDGTDVAVEDSAVATPAPERDDVDQTEPTAEPDPTAESEPEPAPTATAEPEPEADAEPEAEADTEQEVDTEPTDEPEPASGAETVDWRSCRPAAECGQILVPADYDDPDAGMLEIELSIHRAADVNERVGYLLVNPGGPGFPGIDLALSADVIFTDEVLESFDIVGFDPRGVGMSEPRFACGEGDEQLELLKQIDEIPDTDDEVAIGNQAAQLCIDSMGPVGARLHSEFVARDMDEIRKALGADQISYLGFSYGSALGGWYASLFPERVYSMVVDGASNPLSIEIERDEQIQELRDNLGPIHEQFEAALLSCDDSCPIWNDGDPRAYWYQTLDKLDIVQEAVDGDSSKVFLGILGNMYSEATWPLLHDAIFELNANDNPLGFVDAIVEPPGESGASLVGHINCLDMWALYPELTLDVRVANSLEIGDELDAIAAEDYPLLGQIDLPEQGSSCTFYGAIDPPVFEGVFDGGGVPILVIGNISDPFTSFIKSEEYANDVLADGRLVRVDHPSHVVYPANPCVNELVHSALIDQEFPSEEVLCDAAESVGDIVLESFVLPDGASSVRPEGWREIAPGVFAKGDPTDQPVLAFQPTFGDPDAAIAGVEQIFGATAESGGELEFGGQPWQVYEIAANGVAARFAVSSGDDGVVIIGQSAPEDLDEVTERVLIPAAEAFEPAP